jgi:hypothetical protein
MVAVTRLFGSAAPADEWRAQNADTWILGGASEAAETVRAFAAAGAERIVFQDWIAEDLPMIDLLGSLARDWADTRT